MVLTGSRASLSGVEAFLKSRVEAAVVVSSFVLRLKMQETRT
jgi:hypothetical protein